MGRSELGAEPEAGLTLHQPEETHPLPAHGDIPRVLRTFLQAGQAGSLHQGGENVHKLHQGLREQGLGGGYELHESCWVDDLVYNPWEVQHHGSPVSDLVAGVLGPLCLLTQLKFG